MLLYQGLGGHCCVRNSTAACAICTHVLHCHHHCNRRGSWGNRRIIDAWPWLMPHPRSARFPSHTNTPCSSQVWLESATCYNSVMSVNDSDHKPVYALLTVQLPWYQAQQQRAAAFGFLWQAACGSSSGSGSGSNGSSHGGSLSLVPCPTRVVLQGSCSPGTVELTNPDRRTAALFAVQGAGGTLPAWLDVCPAAGVIQPGGRVALRLIGTKASWGAASGATAELLVYSCLEGSADAAGWPASCAADAQPLTVQLI